MEKKINKGEKGSVTLFVLISMIFLLIVLVLTYSSKINQMNRQKSRIAEIERQYEQRNIEEIYYEILSKDSAMTK